MFFFVIFSSTFRAISLSCLFWLKRGKKEGKKVHNDVYLLLFSVFLAKLYEVLIVFFPSFLDIDLLANHKISFPVSPKEEFNLIPP